MDPEEKHADEHFRTVSRKHVTLEFKSPEEIVIRDTSANGTFIDGRRIAKTCMLKNLPEQNHELKLGTSEAFRVEWARLIQRKKMKTVEVGEDEDPPEGAVPVEDEDAGGDAEEITLDDPSDDGRRGAGSRHG